MKLHEYKEDFKNLISIVSKWKNISEVYIERDYFIVYTLMKLQDSEYNECCVFKGGTSLSKCYPGSIERFSEDIDLTYLSETAQSDRQIEKDLKKIEQILASDATLEKIGSERNSRNKSSFIKYNDDDNGKIKLEIGSCVKPDPFQCLSMRTYIHEYLLENSNSKAIRKFEFKEISINTLQIERTFLDKVFAIKRHTLCGTIEQKVRHLYDVTVLFRREEIQKFIIDYKQLKKMVQLTKSTDYFYFEKEAIQ